MVAAAAAAAAALTLLLLTMGAKAVRTMAVASRN
jgi:hypothetical protein